MNLAGCIITDNADRILLLHRNTNKHHQWEIPGGKIEDGEEPAVAAVREIKEELGIEVKIEKFLGKKEFTEDGITLHYAWYESKIVSDQPKIMEPMIFDDIRYFSQAEMHQIILSQGAKSFIAMLEEKHL